MDVVYDTVYEKQRNFCDAGPHNGMYRYIAYVYVTREEQVAMDERGEDFPVLALVQPEIPTQQVGNA
jgi:hypothetical protein